MQETEINTYEQGNSANSYLGDHHKSIHRNCLTYGGLGGVAGLIMEGFLHPIDTIRTRMKANTKEIVSLTTQVKTMYKHEGHSSYFRGFTCTLAGAFVANASYFYTYEMLRHVAVQHELMSKDTAPFLAAFVGGFLANVLYLPFDMVRTRMQLKPGHYDYSHFFDGARKVLKHEGFSKLYFGGSVFFTLNALETSLTFGFYELFYQSLKPLFPSSHEVNIPLSVACSVSAASLAGFVLNPLDVLMTRLQSVNHKVDGPISVGGMAKKILKDEGIRGFFKGVTGTMSYYALGALILFPTYETLKCICHVDLSN